MTQILGHACDFQVQDVAVLHQANDELCVHLIVVNTEEAAFVGFELEIALPSKWRSRPLNATRLFDAGYNRTIDAEGVLSDLIAPGETNIYEIGCSRRWK